VNPSPAEQIARTLLYEGYILYPYRASALKNRHRWTFGGLMPQSYAEASGNTERWFLHTECLIQGGGDATLSVAARFLHPLLTCDRGSHSQEATERVVSVSDLRLGELEALPRREAFAFPAWRSAERVQHALLGEIELSAVRVAEQVFRLAVRVSNLTPLEMSEHVTRDEAVLRSLASAHVALGVRAGGFVSPTDPGEELRSLAAVCRNEGVWPILVGQPGNRDAMLASPIILEDYPRIAPESTGDFFDGTEIDEMLALRVHTLTDDEKREMAESDPCAKTILERVESLSASRLATLHGTSCPGSQLQPGSRVRLRPRGRADAFDIVLAGKSARVVSIEEDFEGIVYFAVTVDDDPGRDLGDRGQPGHRFFFRRDEVELLGEDTP